MYYKNTNDGYILSLSTGKGIIEITESEYNTILSIIHNAPTAPDGYSYRLKEDLTWELYELPPASEINGYTEDQLLDKTEDELTDILADMGVSITMNKSNMIRMIMLMQEAEIS